MINILLVEDDEGDALLLQEAMRKTDFKNNLNHMHDGVEAQEFLKDPENLKPDLILLDLNMPRMGGHEVLEWIKREDELKDIPVGIFTTSTSEEDIKKSYQNQASYYITKPANFEELTHVVSMIDAFWTKTVQLPKRS